MKPFVSPLSYARMTSFIAMRDNKQILGASFLGLDANSPPSDRAYRTLGEPAVDRSEEVSLIPLALMRLMAVDLTGGSS